MGVDTSAVGGRVTVTSSGTTNFGYDVDQRNRITSIKTGGVGAATAVRYDASGNLQFDGTYFYQYDAWNRLIQVNLGLWESGGTIAIGSLVKNYAYDGLGRLVRTLSPYPNPAAGGTFNRAERFYYDGIRRIQEVLTDPILSSGGAEGSGDPGTEELAGETTPPDGDKQGTPLGLEAGLTGSTQVHQWLGREYVWGPGDGPGGVDELLVQYDNQRVPWWVIQDEGGDIVALCDLGAVSADGRVVGQYIYDAYGSPLSFDYLHAHPQMRCGHKGLFVDRLDVGVVLAGNVESTRITPGATVICHNRNRTYAPKLGRFLQQDPNASGHVVIETSAYQGQSLGPIQGALRLDTLYGDGNNLYQALGSNPWLRCDPLGLTWTDMLTAETALMVLNAARAKIGQLLVEHYAKMVLASEVAYGLAQGESNPGSGSLWGTEAQEAVQALRQFAGGKMTTTLLDDFSAATFRTNSLRLWGMEGNLFSTVLRAHHIIPQWDKVGAIMNRLGVGNMTHNPVFSTLLTESEHQIIHAGSGPGGWYNRLWLRGLEEIEQSGVHGDDAANAIIDFIGKEVIPRVREAMLRGGPPAGF